MPSPRILSALAIISIWIPPAFTAPAATLPKVQLPYGTWQAFNYDAKNDLYVFKNIRFGQPPTGPLRWQKPQTPIYNSTVQDGTYGPACMQATPATLLGASPSSAAMIQQLQNLLNLGGVSSFANQTGEDCLFLDVYVPGKALQPGAAKLPVLNWIYGGAYLVGSKEGIYQGTPLVAASKGNFIYVAGNYRLGAAGFLAGTTVENGGVANAALWDQRTVLQWIQQYINLFGGDPTQVTAMGESAGAGSIYHHLTAFGGKQPALFKRAIVQSPAYDIQIDRKGLLVDQFDFFAKAAGCSAGAVGLSCLRNASLSKIMDAQNAYSYSRYGSKPGWGPAADGTLVPTVPSLQLDSGNVAPDVEVIFNSHMADEPFLFTPSNLTNENLYGTIDQQFGTYPPVASAVKTYFDTKYKSDAQSRFTNFIQFGTFTCHNRGISKGFQNRIVHNVKFSRPVAGRPIHGTDIIANFYDKSNAAQIVALNVLDRDYARFNAAYRSYIFGVVQKGDVNALRNSDTILWPKMTYGPTIGNVLNITKTGSLFEIIQDDQTMEQDCRIWLEATRNMTNALRLNV